ncbi:GNAT family N-acetyltransferase [Dyadobacter subterraneus]|uniref:GNAT family N-acetyltransferase n=1 Tax=Dyadobacter subterraneus TaxID=2773304 RepID=A0ABR9WI17_9BACT|nr:GNAT family N-acetyltransferase [Dyadobacter subterraneus]MBE9465140.1 GNAT family N-acetyltransferase [Dyadobacter subterraneus]
MIFREARIDDIPQIQVVRHAVKENILSDPSLVTDQDCIEYLTVRGKGWVCEIDNQIIGFSIADLKDNNIWALFLKPEFEKRGIGRQLHDQMLNWYFSKKTETVWLSTTPGTKADQFYRRCGWTETGNYGTSQIRFEMTFEKWSDSR